MQKRQNSLYPYLVLSDKTLIATKLKNLVFTEFQNFRGFVGSPWENCFPKSYISVFLFITGDDLGFPPSDCLKNVYVTSGRHKKALCHLLL